MKEITKKIIKKVSNIDYNLEKIYPIQRKVQDLGGFLVPKNKYIDTFVLTKDCNIPIRIFFPTMQTDNIILYYHGGGWVVGTLNYYNYICYQLAIKTGQMVIAIDYRLAPEFPYPAAFNDCYEVTKYFCAEDNFLNSKCKNISIMGDSAGATLAAGISLYVRDTTQFKIKKQVLIYPLTSAIHGMNSPFASARENGDDWLLTTKKINEYMRFYVQDLDQLQSPYVIPLNETNYHNQPDTLIITAELDPLRDEGEEYGRRLAQHNCVEIKRVPKAIHGFFSLPISSKETIYSLQLIDAFLKGEK